MHINRELRATTLALMVLLGTIISSGIPSHSVSAQSSGETTTLYFTKYTPLSFEDNLANETQMSLEPPTTANDSAWPPSIFIPNGTRLLPKLNTQELLTWIELWVMFKFSDFQSIFGDTEGLPDEYNQYIQNLFDMFNPFIVREDYTYTGEKTAEISGDILFNLYFASNSKYLQHKDNVKVSISKTKMLFDEIPLSEEIKNTTATVTPTLIPKRIIMLPINLNLENETITVEPDEILTFAVEIIPSERAISKLLNLSEQLGFGDGEKIKAIADFLSKLKIETFQQWGETLKELVNMTEIFKEEGINLTLSDFGEITDALQGSSFIFGSSTHPSQVILPMGISGETENSKIYYLHDQSKMNETKTTNDKPSETDFSKTPIKWEGPALPRSKILKHATAILYLNARSLLRKIPVTATLYNGEEKLATNTQNISRDILLTKPNEPVTFTFNDINEDINYDSSLTLGIAVANGSKLGLFGKIHVLYDAEEYPSLLTLTFGETDNIKFTLEANPSDGLIVPGSSVLYTLNITSNKTDEISVTYTEVHNGSWHITIVEDTSISLTAGETVQVHLFVNSTDQTKNAYGDTIDVTIVASGKTGIDRHSVFTDVTQDAIHYKVEILGYSGSININKGENRTFFFVIKNNNTGAIDDVDSYTITASSKNDWPLIPRESIRNLQKGHTTNAEEARVVIQVPKDTTLNSDVITITVTSDSDTTAFVRITVTVHIIAPGLLESIYNLFNSAAETLGLNDMFGSYGWFVLAILIVVIILFLLIILALVLTSKDVRIICTDRIKEIEATEKAIFEITLKNPTKKTRSYVINAQQTGPSSKWMVTREPETLTIDGRQSKTAQIIVTPTENTESNDWTQIILQVKKAGKKKTEHVTLMAMIKKNTGATLLQISDITHWPVEFNPGERMTTSCNVLNKGTVSARNVKVFFYLNGKQKNMAEVTIPAGGFAEIQMPWIAVKGKNHIRLRIKEQ